MYNRIRISSNQKDIRFQKTHKALYDAMITILGRVNFNEVTVNDLCSEALVSRATFYAHFNDKYDLLKYVLTQVQKSIIKNVYKYDKLEEEINQFIFSNKKILANLIKDANSETLSIIRDSMSSIIDLTVKRKVKNKSSPHHIILFNFMIGGLVNLLTWIVEHNFPPDVNMMNLYLYKLLESVMIWDAEQEKQEIMENLEE